LHLAPLRVWVTKPAAVAMLFSAEDCATSVPRTDLANTDFTLLEDGEKLSSEAHRDVLTDRGYRVEVDLLLDVSDSTLPNRAQIVEGARSFVQNLLITRGLANKVSIGLWVFDGSSAPSPVQYPTSNASGLLQKLETIETWKAKDGGATNLNGALRQAVEGLQQRLVSLMVDNAGGVAATGHLLVFTDGGDSARREDATGASTAIQGARTLRGDGTEATPSAVAQTWAVTLKGNDYDPKALRGLLGPERYLLEADSVGQLSTKFQEVASQIGAQVQGTYLFAYCSAKRTGMHQLSLGLRDGVSPSSDTISLRFNANGFEGGCNAEFFANACEDRECGGLACGSCDPETQVCNTSSLQCKAQ
jgi:hypothetical protein